MTSRRVQYKRPRTTNSSDDISSFYLESTTTKLWSQRPLKSNALPRNRITIKNDLFKSKPEPKVYLNLQITANSNKNRRISFTPKISRKRTLNEIESKDDILISIEQKSKRLKIDHNLTITTVISSSPPLSPKTFKPTTDEKKVNEKKSMQLQLKQKTVRHVSTDKKSTKEVIINEPNTTTIPNTNVFAQIVQALQMLNNVQTIQKPSWTQNQMQSQLAQMQAMQNIQSLQMQTAHAHSYPPYSQPSQSQITPELLAKALDILSKERNVNDEQLQTDVKQEFIEKKASVVDSNPYISKKDELKQASVIDLTQHQSKNDIPKAPAPKIVSKEYVILVSNLPRFDTSGKRATVMLKDICKNTERKTYSSITSVCLHTDVNGKPIGSAEIICTLKSDAMEIIKRYHHKVIDDHRLSLSLNESKLPALSVNNSGKNKRSDNKSGGMSSSVRHRSNANVPPHMMRRRDGNGRRDNNVKKKNYSGRENKDRRVRNAEQRNDVSFKVKLRGK